MSRPLTKGELIPLRLHLSADDRVRADARAAGVSPGIWLARFVEEHYGLGGRYAAPLVAHQSALDGRGTLRG